MVRRKASRQRGREELGLISNYFFENNWSKNIFFSHIQRGREELGSMMIILIVVVVMTLILMMMVMMEDKKTADSGGGKN